MNFLKMMHSCAIPIGLKHQIQINNIFDISFHGFDKTLTTLQCFPFILKMIVIEQFKNVVLCDGAYNL